MLSVSDPDLWAESEGAYWHAARGFDGAVAPLPRARGRRPCLLTVRADATVSLPAFVDRGFAALDAADWS